MTLPRHVAQPRVSGVVHADQPVAPAARPRLLAGEYDVVRQQERQVLSDLLPRRQIVVATGGGTFAEPDNRALMLADGAVAWLDVPLARVFERVPADGRRPLAADRAQMEQLYARRRLTYADAHLRIDGTEPIPDVVERLLEWVGY